MRHRAAAARASSALAAVAAFLAWASPARADVDGFAVDINQAPTTFIIGKNPLVLTAAVSTDVDGGCRKIRWALDIRTNGIDLDQIRVNRVENDQSFPVRAQADGDTARLVDVRFDPGQLCEDQNVSGRWDIAFIGPDSGGVEFEVHAFDAAGRQLSSAETRSQVLTPVAATPIEKPSPSPSPTPTKEDEEDIATEEPADDDIAAADSAADSAALKRTSGTPSVLGPGLIVGAVLVFLGVSRLLRIRNRNRKEAAWQAQAPTGFDSARRRR